MISYKHLIGVLLLSGAIACNQAGTKTEENDHDHGAHNAATAAPANREDSLFREVVDLHDEAMPKMGQLRGYQKRAQEMIDSLAGLKDAASREFKGKLETLLAGLQRADKGMMDWMDGFETEPKRNSPEEVIQYFESEKVKAKAMRDDIFNMLDSARALIGQ